MCHKVALPKYHGCVSRPAASSKPADHHSRLLQGFLLPLCAAGDCSLREAVIVAAVLRRVSLPVGSSIPCAHDFAECTLARRQLS